VRACILGGGLAGALLTWRMAQSESGWLIDVVLGGRTGCDATAASGGAVRAFENDRRQRELATSSLLELLDSPTLRDWSGYQPAETVYLSAQVGVVPGAVAELQAALPGSAELLDAGDLRRRGWAGVADGQQAVLERAAGYTAPDRFRTGVLADVRRHRSVSLIADEVTAIACRDDGTVSCRVAGLDRSYDVVVVAAGSWTGAVLRASGLPADGYRTKSIQYSIYPVGPWSPSEFVDEHTGLFGRPTIDGQLLLGLPTDEWDVDPDRPALTPALHDRATELAARRFPHLRLGPATTRVSSTDCYCDVQMLALRSVVNSGHRLFTFSGGSGGSVKTVLAASRHACMALTESVPRTAPLPNAEKVTT
jgi:hypothetical protein